MKKRGNPRKNQGNRNFKTPQNSILRNKKLEININKKRTR
jgi:hypothetical protein